MKRILITAMESGAGKTVVSCALMKAFMNRGLKVEGFKCGPDYIDPMFHRRVTGTPGYNLDPFLQGSSGPHELLKRQKADIAVIEGAMGYYDGRGGTQEASAYELAAGEKIPVLLVIRPKGNSLTLAAQVNGLKKFRSPDQIRAIFLTGCSPSLYRYLKEILERETGIPVAGFLPVLKEAELESRHLGLVTAGEMKDLEERIRMTAETLENTTDLSLLLKLMDCGAEIPSPEPDKAAAPKACRIAAAFDEAFCFYYRRSLESLAECGASILYFSPVHDNGLPECDGLYLGGGYPELYAKTLSGNRSMRKMIRQAVLNGMPTIAECGGFLYLQRELEDAAGQSWPMAGVLPGKGYKTDRLVRFGYSYLCPKEDSLLFRKGERIPAHEFHYWDCTENGTDILSVKGNKTEDKGVPCGFIRSSLYAAFPHLYLDGELPLAKRFVDAAVIYRERKQDRGQEDLA